MAYIALYRKWRPLVFEDVVEQEHVVKTLKHSVSIARIAHAYLFCGTRGTGKTTMAHILSRAINCLNPQDGNPCNQCEICSGILAGSILDVLEIDAASNNSVDNIREIRDEIVYAPSRAKFKVYIIDEVHMLSTGAFNALLKTLEEPPEHVVFILATTEPHKLPVTVLSRCQRFDFRRITVESIAGRLETIAESSGVVVHRDALKLMARLSDGALRDAISLLDQCISLGHAEISYEDVLSIVGIVNDTFIADVVEAVKGKNVVEVLGLIEKLVMDGKDITQFVSDLILYYRNILICKVAEKPEEIIEASREAVELMKNLCPGLSREEVTCIIKELSLLESALKWSSNPRILLEVSLIKLCENSYSFTNDELLERLSLLERRLNDVSLSPKPAAIIEPEVKQPVQPGRNNSIGSSRENPDKNTSAAEVKQSGSPQGSKSLEGWNDILKELKSSGRMALYSYLFDTKAIEFDNKFIGIVFKPESNFNRMLVSKPENLGVVEEIIGKKLSREIRVKCLDENDMDQVGKNKDEEDKDDFMEKAKDLAQRLDVELNIIDE